MKYHQTMESIYTAYNLLKDLEPTDVVSTLSTALFMYSNHVKDNNDMGLEIATALVYTMANEIENNADNLKELGKVMKRGLFIPEV